MKFDDVVKMFEERVLAGKATEADVAALTEMYKVVALQSVSSAMKRIAEAIVSAGKEIGYGCGKG